VADLPHDRVLVVQCPTFIIDTSFAPGSDLIAGDMYISGTGSQKEPIELQKHSLEFDAPEAHIFFHFDKAVEVRRKNTLEDKSVTHKIHLLCGHKTPVRPLGLQAHSVADC
jgi:hypothetical protein